MEECIEPDSEVGACQGGVTLSPTEAGQAAKHLKQLVQLRAKLGGDCRQQGGQNEQTGHHCPEITLRLQKFEEVMEDGVLDHLVKPCGLFPDNEPQHINGNITSGTTPQAFCKSVTEQLVMWFLHCDEKLEALQRASSSVMVIEARDQPGVSRLA